MQLTNIFTLIALAVTGTSAMPGGGGGSHHPAPPPPPPPPAPPVINHQENYCSSGAPYCCSPSSDTKSGTYGTTCSLSTTQCNSVSICCNNAGNDGTAVCSAATSIVNFPSSSTPSSPLGAVLTSATTTTANPSSQTSRPSPAPQQALSSSPLSSSSNWLFVLSPLLVLLV